MDGGTPVRAQTVGLLNPSIVIDFMLELSFSIMTEKNVRSIAAAIVCSRRRIPPE